jgi:zinc protease
MGISGTAAGRLSIVILTIVVLATQALSGSHKPLISPANVEFVESLGGISQYRLKSNGMTILLSQNHAAPVITFMVVYHIGSRNEAPGNTGSAHLLEHMIFNKSTENFGRARGHKTFQEVLYEAGADYGSTNMTTWYDRMTGYSTLPSDKLDLAMKIEADRLGRALILDEERRSEMSVVRNEFEIGENNPGRVLQKEVIASAIRAHPYHWTTLGYRSDIEGVSTEKLREHYKTFFWPDNAEAILVGDFVVDSALAMFEREFGAFPGSSRPIPQVITQEPPQEGERRVVVKRPGSVGLVEIAYMRPNALHPDFIPLEVLSGILSRGTNSRLYRAIVERGLATDVDVSNYALRDPYPIFITATVAPGVSHQQVEDSLKTALYRVGTEGVTGDELHKAKEQIEVAVTRRRDGTYAYASNLAEAVASTDWKWFLGYVDAVQAVTAGDVRRVASRYLVPDHATVGWFVPASASHDHPPDALSAAPVAPPAAAPILRGEISRKEITDTGPAIRRTFAERTVHRILPNGIVLDIVENHAVPTVAIEGAVFAGSAVTRLSKPALADLAARMMERGTKTRTKEAITALLDDAGARISFEANTFETHISATLLSRDTQLILEIVADEIMHPAFDPEELAKAKVELKNDVLRGNESTGVRAFERLTQITFPEDHPYRVPESEQMLASIEDVGVQDLAAFHRSYFNGSSLIISIVGDIDAQKTVELVERLFGGIPAGTRPALEYPRLQPLPAVREVVTMPGKANMNVFFGHASGLRHTDPDYEAALVANAAVGQSSLASRIGKRVRDTEGLSYSLYSRFDLTDYLDGVWFVSVAVAPVNLAQAMRSTREEFEKYCREGITDEELEVQKNFFTGNYQVHLGSNAGIAAALVTAERFGYGPEYLDEYPERMRKVTREEVNEAIRRHLHPDSLNVVVAGDLVKLPR